MKRDRDKLVWLDFTFIVFCPFGIFSRSWIKNCLGHLETFGASFKDLLPKRFMYRKLMPDIFCHQEPQIQIKCQKSAKFYWEVQISTIFLCHIFFWDLLFLDWSCELLVLSSFGLWCPGPLIPCFSCHLATDQQQSTSKSHQQHSTAINTYQPHSKCTKSYA